jgi:acetyl-CoA synthetase
MKQISNFQEYLDAYKQSVEAPEAFWADVAEDFTWQKKWDNVLQWNFDEPSIKWYDGAKVNLTENCLDRHLADKSDQVALIWEPNDINEQARSITYKKLHAEVCRFANALVKLV